MEQPTPAEFPPIKGYLPVTSSESAILDHLARSERLRRVIYGAKSNEFYADFFESLLFNWHWCSGLKEAVETIVVDLYPDRWMDKEPEKFYLSHKQRTVLWSFLEKFAHELFSGQVPEERLMYEAVEQYAASKAALTSKRSANA